jgi:aminopeptidase N
MYRSTFILLFLVSSIATAQRKNYALMNKGSGEATVSTSFYQNNKMNFYNIKYLKLEMTAQPQSKYITGICSYKVITKQALDTFAIEFKQTMSLDSVFVNNIKQTFTRSNDHIYIAFNPVVAAGTELNLKFYYNGTVANGIFTGLDPNTGLMYTATVSESYQAREWFPAKQLLNDKIDSTDTWITTGAAFKAGSNGVLKQVVDLPGNSKQYRWSCRYPLSYYMPMFAVANYMEYDNYAKPAALAGDSILVQNYLVNNPTYFANNKVLLDKTPRYIEKFSELYGLYPFYKEKYGHAQANIGGGMEHATMTTLQNFEEQLVAHELGHQWFGDNVTCASWNDIWLNESFATYSQYLAIEKLPSLFPITAANQMVNFHNTIMSLPNGSVYVPLTDTYNESRIFDYRLTYAKGAGVLHNLRFEMQSDTLFFNTLKTYQQRFKDTFATTSDFKQVAEQVSGKNLTDFFNQWIYGEGYPTYSVMYQKQGTDTLVLNVTQTTSWTPVTPLFKGLMEYKITSAQGDTVVKLNQTANNQTFKIYYPKTPTDVVVDPNNWVINGTGTITMGPQLPAPPPPILGGIKFYPNPVKSSLNISFGNATFETIQLIDFKGRVMQTIALATGVALYTLPMHVPAGVYLVKLIGKNQTVSEKIVVGR